MTVETILLILESTLLIATIILLLCSIREGRGRKKLLLEVGRATKILTRQEYFLTITDSMMDARVEIIGFITGRPPIDEDKKRVREIINNVERLTKSGIKVKYLVPKFTDRLHIGHLYSKAGAEVRYNICSIASDIRYIIVDDRFVVIGIPESIGEKEATKKGYKIPSEGLATILEDHFNKCWKESMMYENYIKESIKQTGFSPKQLGRELQIDEKEIEKFIEE